MVRMITEKRSGGAMLRKKAGDSRPAHQGRDVPGARVSLTEQIVSRLAILGMTERRAALQAGLSPDSVKEIIAGRRRPRPGTLKRIGRALGCELEGYAD